MDSKSNQAQSAYRYSRSRQQTIRCTNCDIEIFWNPTIVEGKVFCCTGCAAGGPCSCDYSQYHSVNIAGIIHYVPDNDAEKR